MRDLEGIIFDKDGTLVDMHRYWGEIIRRRSHATIARYGLDIAALPRLCASMGLRLETGRLMPQGPVGLASREEVIKALRGCLDEMGVPTTVDEVSALFKQVHNDFLPDIDRHIQPIEGVAPFLAALHGIGARMAVVTSDTVANTRRSLDLLGLGVYFQTIVGHDSTPEPKVSGVPALRALEAMGCGPAATVCVGDAPMDAIMTSKSGCRACIGVATGQIPVADLMMLTPYVAASMAELSCGSQA